MPPLLAGPWSVQATAAAHRRYLLLLLLRPRPVRPLRFLALLALYLSVGSLLLSHSAPLVARLAARAGGTTAGSGGPVAGGSAPGGPEISEEPSGPPLEGALKEQELRQLQGAPGGGGGWSPKAPVLEATNRDASPPAASLPGPPRSGGGPDDSFPGGGRIIKYRPPWMRQRAEGSDRAAGGHGKAALPPPSGVAGVSGLAARTASEQDESGKARYVGCYADDPKQRTLQGLVLYDYRKMTLFRCHDNCADRGYRYAGLEFGAECYCGHRVQGRNVSEDECKMECKGERSAVCGGANRLSVYRLELAHHVGLRYGSAVFRGCFQTPENASVALPVAALIPNLTVGACVDFCAQKELVLAALGALLCRCGVATSRFPLREPRPERLCAASRCPGEPSETCGSETHLSVYQTQVSDKRCVEKRFLPPSRGPRRLVALASFPGAGNTWTRHLLELATGYYTGSYYFDGSLYNKGFKGEKDPWRSGRTLCVKTHESGRREIEAFDAAVLLVRNPYRALMAEFNRKYGGHLGYASEKRWRGKEWVEFVHSYAPWWASHALDWLRYGPRRLLVVHYERLRSSLLNETRRMVAFLGPPPLPAGHHHHNNNNRNNNNRNNHRQRKQEQNQRQKQQHARPQQQAASITNSSSSSSMSSSSSSWSQWDFAATQPAPPLPPPTSSAAGPTSSTSSSASSSSTTSLAVLEERLLCTEAHRDGSFKRSGRRKLPWDPFSAAMRAAIDSYVRVVNEALVAGGHGPLPSEYCCPPPR